MSNKIVDAICDLFHIGADSRAESVLMSNIKNTIRRTECLDEIERRFFTSEIEDEDGEELIDEEGPMYEVTCPNCGDVVTVDESILSLGSIECPGCGKILEFDLGARDE